jgi:hypothetical protein
LTFNRTQDTYDSTADNGSGEMQGNQAFALCKRRAYGRLLNDAATTLFFVSGSSFMVELLLDIHDGMRHD